MAARSRPRVRLEDVAAEAGVSLSTASKVINGRPGLTSETRSRVERAATTVGYAHAGSAPSTVTRIVVAFDSFENPHSARVLEGLAGAAQVAGIELITRVIRINSDPVRHFPLDAAWARDVASLAPAGVIAVTTKLSAEFLAACTKAKLPIIAIDAVNPLDDSVVSVGSTDWMGGYQATKHLIELGHRRIAFVAGDHDNVALRQRLAGYREAIATSPLRWDDALVSEAGMATAGTVVTQMLTLEDRPTAFFAGLDAAAYESIRAIEIAGLRVPADASVVGYDDAYPAYPTQPRLSTIRVPYDAIGEMALDLVGRLRGGNTPPTSHVQLSTSLVVRDTSGPVPSEVRQPGR